MAQHTKTSVPELPKCGFCGKVATYDFKTMSGQWGYGCKHCYKLHRLYDSLGDGKGQELIVDRFSPDPPSPQEKNDPPYIEPIDY